jgi:TatD DNase family protein
MNLIDIHCHLDNSRFGNELNKVIEKCRKANVKVIITSGVNSSTNRIALKIAEKYKDIVKVSFGIYPLDALSKEIDAGEGDGFVRDIEKMDLDSELKWIEKNKDKCIAIGECGLDYKFSQEKEKQKELFQRVINLALKLNKPLIIHSRKAEQDAIDVLKSNKCKKVVLHCFNGRRNLIKHGIELGYYFSIPPIITRLEHFRMLAEMVPLNQILTETDAPYLSSIPGIRNDSSQVAITIKEIAKIKQLDEEKVAEEIFNNYKRLFG